MGIWSIRSFAYFANIGSEIKASVFIILRARLPGIWKPGA